MKRSINRSLKKIVALMMLILTVLNLWTNKHDLVIYGLPVLILVYFFLLVTEKEI